MEVMDEVRLGVSVMGFVDMVCLFVDLDGWLSGVRDQRRRVLDETASRVRPDERLEWKGECALGD